MSAGLYRKIRAKSALRDQDRLRLYAFVHGVFCRITGGMEDRREPPTGLDRTGLRFVPHAAIGLKADSARISHFGSD